MRYALVAAAALVRLETLSTGRFLSASGRLAAGFGGGDADKTWTLRPVRAGVVEIVNAATGDAVAPRFSIMLFTPQCEYTRKKA